MTGRTSRQLGAALLLAALALPGASRAGEHRTRFLLENGAVIRGDVVAADDQALTIASPSLGQVRLPRDSVREVTEPAAERTPRADAHQRVTTAQPRETANLEIRTRVGAAEESAELLERLLSVRASEPLPAKIAE